MSELTPNPPPASPTPPTAPPENSSTTPPAKPGDAPAVGGNPPPAEPAKPAEGEKPAEPAKPVPPAEPITFDALTIPEGFDREHPLSQEFLTLVNDPAVSKKDLAQKLIDLQKKSLDQASERGSEGFADVVSGWRQSLEADPEIGGPKLAASLGEANRIVDQYGTPALKEMLTVTGVGNHPEFARLLVKLAPMVSEPKPVGGGGTPNRNKPTTTNLYPDQP